MFLFFASFSGQALTPAAVISSSAVWISKYRSIGEHCDSDSFYLTIPVAFVFTQNHFPGATEILWLVTVFTVLKFKSNKTKVDH